MYYFVYMSVTSDKDTSATIKHYHLFQNRPFAEQCQIYMLTRCSIWLACHYQWNLILSVWLCVYFMPFLILNKSMIFFLAIKCIRLIVSTLCPKIILFATGCNKRWKSNENEDCQIKTSYMTNLYYLKCFSTCRLTGLTRGLPH